MYRKWWKFCWSRVIQIFQPFWSFIVIILDFFSSFAIAIMMIKVRIKAVLKSLSSCEIYLYSNLLQILALPRGLRSLTSYSLYTLYIYHNLIYQSTPLLSGGFVNFWTMNCVYGRYDEIISYHTRPKVESAVIARSKLDLFIIQKVKTPEKFRVI